VKLGIDRAIVWLYQVTKEQRPMRDIIHKQLPVVYPFIEHEHAEELHQISEILDSFGTEICELVYRDLIQDVENPDKGREGMSADQVLRVLLLKQMNEFSYEKLGFHLMDSMTYRTFCRFGIDGDVPSVSTLKHNLKRVTPETLAFISKKIVLYGRDKGIEDGQMIRTDCTVEETNIHAPKDSHLLYDCVRVLTRLMQRATDGLVDLTFTNHTKRAKRRFRNIEHTGNQNEREKLYRDLIKVTEKTVQNAALVAEALDSMRKVDNFEAYESSHLVCELRHYGTLAQKVIDQTKRRVLYDETVSPKEKVVSIFEPHTDIIVKDRRETKYGHKICLTTGKSGLILDCVVEDGNPSDSKLAVEMVERVTSIYETVPRQVAFDGGFASKENLSEIKNLGVEDVVFNKKRGLEISDMAKSTWVYRTLSFFRAGIEGTISFLKRCFGLRRCMWKGLESFKSYTLASIISHNLLILARHRLN